MAKDERAATVQELLAQTGWMRGVAIRLAGDADVADDIVQETYVAALRRSPKAGDSVRPWLARVMRNALRMRARGDGRRSARERETLIAGDGVPTPESLVAKAEAQRTLAGLVLRLKEPYRSTVLLHFGEGMSLADIARAHDVAAGTARWRLKTALDQLRAWLDSESGGRRQWALVPLLPLPKGVLVAQKSSKAAAAVILLLVLLVGSGVYLMARDSDAGDGDVATRRAGIGGPPEPSGRAGDPGDSSPVWLAQPDVAPRRVAGQVTFARAPVSGATVELANLATESGVAAPLRRTTGADGRFDFGLQAAMEWSVRASAPGKTGATQTLDLRNPVLAPPPDRLEIELGACEAALVGVVRDASGGPIAHARVARLARGTSPVPGGVAVDTDDQGAYELCVEKSWPGRILVEVSADGYGAIVFTGLVLGRVAVDFALVPEATLVGRVVRDDTGEPVAKAHVFLPRGRWGIESTSWRGTFTGEDGRFRMDGVAPGRHLVFARAEGMLGPARGTPALADAGQTTEVAEIRLEAASIVRGVVVEGGKPVAGARVAAVAADGIRGARTAVSQEDGSFALEEVPRGELRFTAWPYDVVSPARFVVDRAEHDGVVLEVEPLGAIVGRVVHGQRGVGGARVHVHGPNDGHLEPIRTDADGRFEARGLRPGPWTLFGESGRDGRFGRAPKTVQLARGETEDVTIDLAYGAAIEGRVVDQDGAPVAGVAVQFWHTGIDDAGVAVTSVDGSFRAATMTGGGQYRTTVRPYQGAKAFLRPASGTEFPMIALADGDSEVTGVVLAVQLDRLSITGRVVDSAGAPVADARVNATLAAGGDTPRFFRWVHYAATTTDVDGGFAIRELSRGTYALQARSSFGADATVGGVRAGRNDVVLTLPTPGAIEGNLVDLPGAARVTAMRTDVRGAAVTEATVHADSFVIRDLAPGPYVVAARTANQAASARVEVSAGSTSRVTLTGGGTATLVGRVREFRTGKPVEGMTCRVQPRAGDDPTSGFTGERARTDSNGTFVLAEAPAGDLAVACVGLWRVYSDGLRLIQLAPAKTLEVDVPVVALRGDVAAAIGGFGADIDLTRFVPRLHRVHPKGPAAAAGLRDGDLVVAVDGARVTELSPRGVRMLITNHPPGTTVRVTVSRGGEEITADLVLVEHPIP